MTTSIRRWLLGLHAAALAGILPGFAHSQTTGAGKPYQVSSSCLISAGNSICQADFKVPFGNIFVIQSVSALTDGSEPIQVLLLTRYNRTANYYPVALVPTASLAPSPGVTTNLVAYAEEGDSFSVQAVGHSTAGGQFAQISVSGYLIASK